MLVVQEQREPGNRARGLALLGVAPTGLPGPKGNLETFLYLGLEGEGAPDGATLCEGVEL